MAKHNRGALAILFQYSFAFIVSSSRSFSCLLESVSQRKRDQIGAEVPRRKNILGNIALVLVVAVITPVGFPCPMIREAIIESTEWLEIFGVQRTRRSVRRNNQNGARSSREICAQARR